MSHDDADKFCKIMDHRAHLIEIHSLEIQKIVESFNVSSHHRFWIGATDQLEVHLDILIMTNTFIWTDT